MCSAVVPALGDAHMTAHALSIMYALVIHMKDDCRNRLCLGQPACLKHMSGVANAVGSMPSLYMVPRVINSIVCSFHCASTPFPVHVHVVS